MELRFREFGFDIELTEEQWSSEWEDILKMSSPAPLSKAPDRSAHNPFLLLPVVRIRKEC